MRGVFVVNVACVVFVGVSCLVLLCSVCLGCLCSVARHRLHLQFAFDYVHTSRHVLTPPANTARILRASPAAAVNQNLTRGAVVLVSFLFWGPPVRTHNDARQMGTEEDGRKAIKALNGIEIQG